MKKTILSLALISAIASGAYAFGGGACQNGGQGGMMQGKGMMQGMHGRGGGHRCLLRRRCPAPQRGSLIFSGGRAARIVGACAGVAHRRTDALALRLGGGARPGVTSPLVRFT